MSATALREAVASEVASCVDFLRALVGAASTRGHERPAQELIAAELGELGFEVTHLVVPNSIGMDPLAGVPAMSYDGRFNVLGTTPHDGGRTLLFNGHIDVVPVHTATWSSDPFDPVVRDGWLFGRGAGDMKGGFAMAMLALRALRRLGVPALRNLQFLSVIEEECTGNGTLAALRAGVRADAVVLPEPTNLNVLLGGVAITWVSITIEFGGGHAESSDRLVSPAQVVARLVDAFGRLEAVYNEDPPAPFDTVARPYNINVGRIELGEWPSSVPAVAEVEVRVGHPENINDEEVCADIEALVAEILGAEGAPPFKVVQSGFRAQSYYLDSDHELVRQVVSSHEYVHATTPVAEIMGSTTDARYYVNQLDVPALCFGPVVRNMHGSDECVELASIERGAATLAKFLLDYLDLETTGTSR